VECEKNLDIGLRRSGANELDADLGKLSVSTALHLFVAEHGPEIAHTQWHRPLAESVFNVGAGDPCRSLRPEGQRSALAVGKRVHLLADNIRVLSNRTYEQLGRLQQRQPNLLVAEAAENAICDCLDLDPQPGFRRQNVAGPLHLANHKFLPRVETGASETTAESIL